MTSSTSDEVDERAFGLFLRQGILYFLDQDPILHQGEVLLYASRLRQVWIQMSQQEKSLYVLRAREDLNRLRGDPASELFRTAMRTLNSS